VTRPRPPTAQPPTPTRIAAPARGAPHPKKRRNLGAPCSHLRFSNLTSVRPCEPGCAFWTQPRCVFSRLRASLQPRCAFSSVGRYVRRGALLTNLGALFRQPRCAFAPSAATSVRFLRLPVGGLCAFRCGGAMLVAGLLDDLGDACIGGE